VYGECRRLRSERHLALRPCPGVIRSSPAQVSVHLYASAGKAGILFITRSQVISADGRLVTIP